MLPITKMISPYNHYEGNNIKYLVLHYTGNASDTAKNNAIYFNGGNRNASAHYFVDDISIYQVVEDYNGCWAVGNSVTAVNNKNSISIEMCCSGNYIVSEKTEANAVELAKYIMNKYNIPISNVYTHAEVTNYAKICPNWSANNWSRWNNFKAKLTTSTTTQEVKTVEQAHWIKDDNGWWYKHSDGMYTKNGWEFINGEWYWFNDVGYAFENHWLLYKENWYWFDKDCKMVKSCILLIDGKYYAFDKDGKMKTTITTDSNGAIIL